ncbi:phage tail protein [Achromobacter sp. Marseille-Q0513]|uniref:phage tail protein n=1 Tax=Achromobacter sp. Marseille-Q0513 TaxID=2829161 RepID=UPI001B8DF9C2|nr:phage tail protein [Achromobacter sp. Marseille-Q0513]MBR8652456.1 phage tail protein [Achromobacter sp. Marseille-Q0513]
MRRIATPTRHLNKFGPGRDGFANGDPIAGVPATDLQAEWFDALQEEVAAVAEFGGVALDPNSNVQLLQGIQRLIALALTSRPLICSILDLPTTDVGPIIVTECSEVWTWANTAFFTGYRSLLCGRPLDGHTAAPLASEVDAVGGLLPKVGAYAGLWGYAQEQSLVRTEAVWQANRGAHWFSDYSATQFRVPDLRDMFRRFTGTDLDTANARGMGSKQLDASQHMFGMVGSVQAKNIAGPFREEPGTTTWFAASQTQAQAFANVSFDSSRVVRVSTETRPVNVAYHPRMHA